MFAAAQLSVYDFIIFLGPIYILSFILAYRKRVASNTGKRTRWGPYNFLMEHDDEADAQEWADKMNFEKDHHRRSDRSQFDKPDEGKYVVTKKRKYWGSD